MTVTTTGDSVVYRGNGSATSFAVPFKILDVDHLQVRRRIYATGVFDHTYVGTAYSYSGLGASSGTLYLTGAALSSTYELVIERIVPYTQELDIVNAGGFHPDTVEEQLDIMVMGMQQLRALTDRSLLVPVGEVGSTLDPAPLRTGGKILGFNSSTGALEVQGSGSFQGSPGGNVMSIGLFSIASTLTIPAGTDIVHTSGYNVVGRGFARYMYDAAVDAAYVTANPRTSFISANSRGFRLAETILTPFMFGAVPFDTEAGTATNTLTELQAYFDDLKTRAKIEDYIYDARGEWAIAGTLNIAVPFLDAYTPRCTVLAPTIRVMPLANLPGGVALDYAVDVCAPYTDFIGRFGIHPTGQGSGNNGVKYANTWANRRYKKAMRRRCCTNSTWGPIYADDSARDLIFDKSDHPTPFTHNGLEYTTSSNIGMRTEAIVGRYFGSTPVNTLYGKTLTQTGTPVNTGDVGGYNQRSTIPVTSSAGIEVEDTFYGRMEIPPATYGTATFTNGTRTISFSSGNFTGVVVGDKFHFTAGTNAGTVFELTAIGGTNNRDWTVWPPPTTGTNNTGTLNSDWSGPHSIISVPSGTSIECYPWYPSICNSALYMSMGYAVRADGPDSANSHYGYIGAITSAGGYWGSTLHSPSIGTIKTDHCDIGICMGDAAQSISCLGTTADHVHLEGTSKFSLYFWGGTEYLSIRGKSALNQNMFGVGIARQNGTQLRSPAQAISNLTVDLQGRILTSHLGASYEGDADFQTYYLSNEEGYNDREVPFNTETITVKYDRTRAATAAGRNRAKLRWLGPSGNKPTGSLTFNLDAEWAAKGWAFTGAGSSTSFVVTAPARPCLFLFTYLDTPKLIDVAIIMTRRVFEGSATWDPGSIAGGAQASTTVTVTGAVLGDYPQATPSIDIGALIVSARVTAADTVTVTYGNLSGGAIDPASHTVYALVEKRA